MQRQMHSSYLSLSLSLSPLCTLGFSLSVCVSIEQMMSEVGRVYAVHPGGDVLVMGKGKSWVFNPLCLSHAADDKEETAEDNPC